MPDLLSLTVLFGGRVAGYRLKPFVIWHSDNPMVFKHISKHTLPVYHRSSKMSWMTHPPLPRCPPEFLYLQNGEVLFGEHTFQDFAYCL